jgi:hypothetical protein
VYSEGEFLFDRSTPEDSFFYNWSEVSVRAFDRWRVGLVTQRTRVRNSPRDIQRGPLVGVLIGSAEFTAYLIDGSDTASTLVISVGWSFDID